MPLHKEFQKLLNDLVNQHGKDKGSSIFYSYIKKYKLDETKSLNSQRPKKYVDAFENNYSLVRQNMDNYLSTIKNQYALVIQKYIDELFDESILTASKELSMTPIQLTNFNKMNAAKDILKENFITLNFELIDAIDKELTLMITDMSLNGIPLSDNKLKSEIRQIFESKQARLESQVITESTRATNTFLEIGYKESGLVFAKQWVAIIDGATTSTCRGLNGAIVDIGRPFATGDYQPPAHINCRSRIEPITIKQK